MVDQFGNQPELPYPWAPWHVGDPIHMEYALRDAELDAGVKNRLLATHFETVAGVHEAIAQGARRAAELVGGG
jgi:hypothetical protein